MSALATLPYELPELVVSGSTGAGGSALAQRLSLDPRRPAGLARIGALALVGPKFPTQLRVFLLTVAIVDDIVAIHFATVAEAAASAACGAPPV